MKLTILLSLSLLAAGFSQPLLSEEEAQAGDAQQAAIDKIEQSGGAVRPIAQDDDRLEVDFHLQGESVGDDAVAPVAELNVVRLHLGNTGVTDQGLAHIEDLKTLEALHLEKTKISDEGLEHLGKLENLRYLNLYGTQVGDEGLQHLQGLSSLEKLYLWKTNVTDAGVNELQEALPDLEIDTGWELQADPSESAEEESTDAK